MNRRRVDEGSFLAHSECHAIPVPAPAVSLFANGIGVIRIRVPRAFGMQHPLNRPNQSSFPVIGAMRTGSRHGELLFGFRE